MAAVTLVTLGAFENRATSTVLPSVMGLFDALGWFGIATTVPGLLYLAAAPLAGTVSDRFGPGRVLATGMVAFVGGSTLCGLAPSVGVFVIGRACTGVAEALFDIALTVQVAQRVPEALRPRLLAAYSAAWLLPSLAGPQVAAIISDAVGWRWVFGGSALALLPVALVLGPFTGARRETAPSRGADNVRRHAVPTGILLLAMAAAAGLTPAAERGLLSVPVAVGLALTLGVVALVATLPLNPPGTVRLARGLPAAVALNAVLSASFGLASAFLPLYAQRTRGLPPGQAGTLLTITGFAWAAGAWLQSLPAVQRRSTAPQRVGLCALAIGVGVAGLAWFATPAPLWQPFAAWTLAGVGIGCGSATLTTVRLALTDDDSQGRYAAGANLMAIALMSSSGMALGLALVGAPPDAAIGSGGAAVAIALGAVCLLAATLSFRLTDRDSAPATAPTPER